MADDNNNDRNADQLHIGSKILAGGIYVILIAVLAPFVLSTYEQMVYTGRFNLLAFFFFVEMLAPFAAVLLLFRRQTHREIMTTLAVVIALDIFLLGISIVMFWRLTGSS